MRWNAPPERGLALLAACSLEAGWLTLAYVAAEGLAHGPAPLTILPFAAAAALGLGWARRAGHGSRRLYATLLACLVVIVALAGWLVPLGPGAADVVREPLRVFEAHPGGILLGIAVLRGAVHADADEERVADTALGAGLVALAMVWVLMTAAGLGRQPSITASAFSATLTFVTAALLAIGLARLGGLRGAGVHGASRRTWDSLVLGVVAAMLAVALPLALILGVPVDRAVRGVLGPVWDVLVMALTLVAWPAGLLAAALVGLFDLTPGSTGTPLSSPGRGGGPRAIDFGPPSPAGVEPLVIALVPLLVGVIVAFLVVRSLVRWPSRWSIDGNVVEVREPEPPAGGLRLPRPHLPRPRRHPAPRTASEAYLAGLELLATRPALARLAHETPAEHARRLRADRAAATLSRLAIDYELAEFGRRSLSTAEHLRAVARFRRLQSLIRR